VTLSLSKRANQIVQSEIRNMTIECEKVSGVNLAQGVCNLGVPEPVTNGAKAAMDAGTNSYTRYDGLTELRNAIARKLHDFNGIDVDPEREITVSAGSTGAFYCACMALLNPGDEVILFEPYYGYHVNTLLAMGAGASYVTTTAPDWTFEPKDLENAVTPKTRGIMVCTPSNPSGKVFTETELNWIADLAIKHDLFIFTDEIYEYFVYDGKKHMSPAALARVRDRTIMISGYSKTFSITGWRIGYAVSGPRWAGMIGYINDLVYVCAPAPLQIGVARGIMDLDQTYYESVCNEFAEKRDRICSTLEKVGLTPCVPQGSYYVLADVSRIPGTTSKEKAMYILKTTGVAGVPGEAFFHGNEGHNFVRFCFAKTDDELNEACERLSQGIATKRL
jgi:aminotransferase